MSESFGVQVSYKFGPQHQHMINIRGDSVQDLAEKCGLVEQIVPSLKQLGDLFGPDQTEEGAIQEIQNQMGGQVISQSTGKVCAHGPMVYKTGMGKNGSPWQAWMCQSPQGAPKCSPIWVK